LSVKEGALEAVLGILVGFLPIIIKQYFNQLPNIDTIIAILELSAILGAINKLDTIQKISWKIAAGYFLLTFTVGRYFMPDWESVFQVLFLIIYVYSKIFEE